MAVNKVVYGGETKIDLSNDTVTPDTLLDGAVAHAADGTIIYGEFKAAMLMTVTGKSVSVSTWVSSTDQSGAGYGYRAAVTISGVTADMVPDVYFDAEEAVSGNFSPVVKSYNGGVYIYAQEKPTAAITIPTIRLTKQQ